MKILYINDYSSMGGAEAVLQELIEHFSVEHEVKTFFPGDYGGKRSLVSYIWNRKANKALAKILHEFQPDSVHVKNYYQQHSPSILAVLKKYKTVCPVRIIYTAHDMHLLGPGSGMLTFRGRERKAHREPLVRPGLLKSIFLLWDYRGRMYSLLKSLQWLLHYRLQSADSVFDEVLVPSVFLADALRPVLQCPVRTVRNPLDVAGIKSQIVSPSGKKSTCAENPQPVRFVFAGRLAADKGLIPFLQRIPERVYPLLELHIYGDGPLKSQIQRLAIQRGMGNIVKLHGKVGNDLLRKELSGYDALFLSSVVYENAPVSIMEAALSGLRIFCPSVGGMKEMAELVGGGYLYSQGDQCDFIDALDKLIVDVQNAIPLRRDTDWTKEFEAVRVFAEHLVVYSGHQTIEDGESRG